MTSVFLVFAGLKIAMEVTDKIKEIISVADLVGEYVKLEKAGVHQKALCPFHNEKSPSFMVNTERNFWYCFGCQKGGDVFSFLMEIEGLDFREALVRLGEKASVEVPQFKGGDGGASRTKKQKVLEILEQSTSVYEKYLKHPEVGEDVRVYLKERKIDKELISDFRIGYALNEWRKISIFLRSKGYSEADILEAGLSVQKAGGEDYDRFRERIMFPVINETGAVVGYSARVVSGGDEKGAKYINTPQTVIYDKSRVLYGLYQGKKAIRSEDSVIVVEGNVDVIASHHAGVKNVVAISGTALSLEQVRILKRYTQNIKLCLDADEAGQKATNKSIQTCLQAGMEVAVIILPEGLKDIGDLVLDRADQWQEISQKTTPVMEYFFKNSFSKNDADTVKGKKIIAKELLNIIKDVADPIEQSYWLKKLSLRIDIEEEVLTKVLEKVSLKKDSAVSSNIEQTDQEQVATRPRKTKSTILEERLLGLFALFPRELKECSLDFDAKLFSEEGKEVFENLIEGKVFSSEVSAKINEFVLRIKYSHDETQGLIENEVDPIGEWRRAAVDLEIEIVEKKIDTIDRDMQLAEELDDDAAAEVLQKELFVLSKRKQDLINSLNV